jgi:hypothetical protein
MEKLTLLLLLLITFMLLFSYKNNIIDNNIIVKENEDFKQPNDNIQDMKKVQFFSDTQVNLFNYNLPVNTITKNNTVTEPITKNEPIAKNEPMTQIEPMDNFKPMKKFELTENVKSIKSTKEPFDNWIDKMKEKYPEDENTLVTGLTMPINSNDKFKFIEYDDENKTLAQLFNDMSGEIDNDITDEQLDRISGKSIDTNSYFNNTETILFENYDSPFRNIETISKYKPFSGNSSGSSLVT